MSEGSGEPVITVQTFLSSSLSGPDDLELFINSLMTEDVIRGSWKDFSPLFLSVQPAGREAGSWLKQLNQTKQRASLTLLKLEI